MHHFAFRDGVLHAEAVSLVGIADEVGTPFYCYSSATLERHYRVFAELFADVPSLVCYALKANSNQAVIATLARLGAGADVVSGGELKRARAAGVPAEKITFSGVGKTERELALAIDEGILCVNVESEPEPALLAGLRVTGIDMHIGSQITELKPFDDAFALLSDLVQALRADGHLIEHLDLGGGLGIPYHDGNEPPPHPEAYAQVVKRATRGLGCTLIFEPG